MLIHNGHLLYQSPINAKHITPLFTEFLTVYSSIPQYIPGQQMLESEWTPDHLTTYLENNSTEYQSWILHLNAFKTVLRKIHTLGHLFPLLIQITLIKMAMIGKDTFLSINSFTFALFFSRQCLAEGGSGVLLRRLTSDRRRNMATFFATYLVGLKKMRKIMPQLLLSENFLRFVHDVDFDWIMKGYCIDSCYHDTCGGSPFLHINYFLI